MNRALAAAGPLPFAAPDSANTDWEARFTQGVAGEIKRHRKARKWSAQKLSDECAALGLPLSRANVFDLENGRRPTLTVAELAVIARALDVPPVQLLYPVGYADEAEVLPGVTSSPFDCARWFAGEAPFPDGEDFPSAARIDDWLYTSGSPLGLYRMKERLMQEERNALRQAAAAVDQKVTVGEGDEKKITSAVIQALMPALDGYRDARAALRRQAAELGLLPPRRHEGEASEPATPPLAPRHVRRRSATFGTPGV